MARRLRANVYLRHGSRVVFLAKGDEIPEWAAAQFSSSSEEGGHEPPPSEAETPQPPPESGPGSGRAAWVEYATSQGLDVPDDMTRAEIIDALS